MSRRSFLDPGSIKLRCLHLSHSHFNAVVWASRGEGAISNIPAHLYIE